MAWACTVRQRQPAAPTNMHNNAISVNSMHRIRSAQDLALYNLTLSEEIDGFDGAGHLDTWNNDHAWQKTRELAEQAGPPPTTGARPSSRPTSCSSHWSAKLSGASWCSTPRRETATTSPPR